MRRGRRSEKGPADDTVELVVASLGAQGDGVAECRGAPVFIPFAVPSERVRVVLGSRRGAGYEGRIVERLAVAPLRAEPTCSHFGSCGGCALQHLAPEDYRAVKLGVLTAALHRVGIDPDVVAPLQTVPPARRRARLGLWRPRDPAASPVIGFRERFRHALVDLRECPVLEPALFALIEPLRRAAMSLILPGSTAEVMLTRCDSGIDLLVESANPPALAALEALVMLAGEYDVARIVWRAGRVDIPVVERRPVRVVFSDAAVPLPPGGFLQASAAAEALLMAEVVAGIGGRSPVLDLYAGLGTFSFALARGGPVHAVEGDAAAASALAAAARERPGISVERRDLDRNPLSPAELAPYTAAVFDPPRAGARRQAEAMARSNLNAVVAVSCNPATFARDAASLVAGGFRLERAVPIDQFVWTPHLELVAVFRR